MFFTSPVETERVCETSGKIEPDPKLVCFSLHGKLRQDEQKRVFENAVGKRKITLATNYADPPLLFPG